MPETESLEIERSKPQGPEHPLAKTSVMEDVTRTMLPKQELVPLVDYLHDIAAKPRGNATGGKEDLNSHAEEFIVKNSEGIHLAFVSDGQLHLFRTIQMRTGEAVIDTPRGFADKAESGEQMYDLEKSGARIEGTMQRIVGEETGE